MLLQHSSNGCSSALPKEGRGRRRAVAAVELAFLVSYILFPLMLGLWQVGRIIQVKQIMDNAAREGARLAAQAQVIPPVGGFTLVTSAPPGQPNVQDTVREYLAAAGVVDGTTYSDVTVTFTFIDSFPPATTWTTPPYSPYPPSTPYQPWMGIKGMRFTVTVTLPINDINWTPFDLSGQNLTSTVTWCILTDDPFTINTTIPAWNPSVGTGS
jgi:hypothetical protein